MKKVLKIRWLPLIIVGIGLLIAAGISLTGPKAPHRAPQRQARLVEVTPLTVSDTQVVIEALGTVQPALEVQLQAQVGGQVLRVSPSLIPGGIVAAGDVLLDIDPRAYEFAVRQRESDLARAEQTLRLEQSQQAIARREYELMGESVIGGDSELMLRQPQLASAKAAYDAAAAALGQAQLDLERTRVVAPFNAMVADRFVDRGAVVTPNTALASLVGTDECWVETLVQVDDLAWIDTPRAGGGGGSRVRVRQDAIWEEGVWREGRVIGRSGSLDAQGRMVRVIVDVDDPFALLRVNANAPVMLMDSFVDVEIMGRMVEDAVAVERSYVHGGDSIWLMDDEGNLRIQTVKPVYAGEHHVLVKDGLGAGMRLVTSHLAAPVDGMPLRVAGDGAVSDDGGVKPGDGAVSDDGGVKPGDGDAAQGEGEAGR